VFLFQIEDHQYKLKYCNATLLWDLGLSKNNKRHIYKPGVANPTLWVQVMDINTMADFRPRRMLSQAHSKVFNSPHLPLHQSQYKHYSTNHVFDTNYQYIIKQLLDSEVFTSKLPASFHNMGIDFKPSTFYKHINTSLGMSLKKGMLTHSFNHLLLNHSVYIRLPNTP
jgi:hypothetical protein